MAEGRGKAQADALRQGPDRDDGAAPDDRKARSPFRRRPCARETASSSRPERSIPGDGTVVEGIASVDESAITGESAPVIRESGGDRSAVTGGTRVLSDQIVVEITSNPGETFLDRMIALVEGASRQKTPNEIALSILLAGLTIVFLIATVTLRPFAVYCRRRGLDGRADRAPRLPHPDDDRRPALGHRHRRHGPRPPAQRPGDVGPRGRGRGRRATSSSSTRPARSRSATGRRPTSSPRRESSPAISPRSRSSRRSRTRRPKADRSSSSRRRSSACAPGAWKG